MTLQAEQPVGHGIIPLLLQQGNRQELALGLGHFSVIGIQVVNMEPVIAPLVAQIAFGLGNLIGMVGEGVVDAAAVKIQIVAQMLHGNAGALNVPAGIAHTPGRIPLEGLILKLGLCKPQHKVILILLVFVLFNALTNANSQIFLVMVIEDIVFVQRGGVKVHISTSQICLALLQQRLHHVDILVDAVGSRLDYIGPLDVQLVAVREEGVGIELRDLHDGLVLAAGAFEHLILAGIRVGCQMAHIGDVHNPLDIVAGVAQGFFQHIFHNIGTQVADVGVVIHRGSAGVHLHLLGIVGNKQFLLVGQRIV